MPTMDSDMELAWEFATELVVAIYVAILISIFIGALANRFMMGSEEDDKLADDKLS